MSSDVFWNAPERARKVVASVRTLKSQVDALTGVVKDFADARLAYEMSKETGDKDFLVEADEQLFGLIGRMEQVELRSLLAGAHDAKNCFLTISAGVGGTEANDWADMLFRMYIFYCEKMGFDVEEVDRGFGAEVKFVGHFQVNDARAEAIRIGKQPGFYCPAQFDNEWNVEENREWLGREIITQLDEAGLKIDAIVQGVGTGGTLIGVGQALRTWHNPDIKIFAMEPSESRTIECCIVADHKIEGISDGFIPTIYGRHKSEVDEIISVKSEVAIEESQRLAREKGLFIGPSSGANYWAAREIKRKYPKIGNVLTLLCDRGEKYFSLMYQA